AASLSALLDRGAAELGADCWVVTPTGRVVAASAPGPPARLGPLGRHSAFAVDGRNAVPWSLVVGAELGPGASEVAEELASLIGLARGREDEVRRTRMHVAAPLVRALADPAGTTEELTRALAATGLPAETPVRLLLARTPGSGAACELLDELLAVLSAGDTALTAPAPDVAEEAWAVVPADSGWPGDWAARATDALASLGRGRILIGAGGPAPIPGLRGAGDEARHAVQAAQRSPERVAVASGDELGMHRLLLAGAPDELRRALAGRVLGTLPRHPELLRTVRIYLECSGSPTKAAERLHVHVNTLRYRIARAGEILDADLTDFRTRVEIYLALSVES
ncbi:PucR family transcriptional regulator, partial [Prauserella alba]